MSDRMMAMTVDIVVRSWKKSDMMTAVITG